MGTAVHVVGHVMRETFAKKRVCQRGSGAGTRGRRRAGLRCFQKRLLVIRRMRLQKEVKP